VFVYYTGKGLARK